MSIELSEQVARLEERVAELEARPRPGRPRKRERVWSVISTRLAETGERDQLWSLDAIAEACDHHGGRIARATARRALDDLAAEGRIVVEVLYRRDGSSMGRRIEVLS